MKDYLNIFEDCKLSDSVVSLHTDPLNMSKCTVGKICMFDNEFVCVRSIGVCGQDEGYSVRKISDVFRVDINGEYENLIKFLSENNGQPTFGESTKDVVGDISNSDVAELVIGCAVDNKYIVTMWTEDDSDSVIGYVKNISSSIIEIQEIGDFGQSLGNIFIERGHIQSLDCNGENEQKLKFLNEFFKH